MIRRYELSKKPYLWFLRHKSEYNILLFKVGTLVSEASTPCENIEREKINTRFRERNHCEYSQN